MLVCVSALATRSANAADQYGGWNGKRFDATGFFRLERSDRWFLVTPDAYLSLGLNHATPRWLPESYNRSHWLKEFGPEGPEGARFVPGFRRRADEDMELFGFNALGCHTPAREHWKPSAWPYVQPFKVVDIDHWRTPEDADFQDVFAAEFESRCEQRADEERLEDLSKDRFLLGYAYTDCPILTELDAAPRQRVTYGAPRAATSTWPRVLRNLPANAPGKKRTWS